MSSLPQARKLTWLKSTRHQNQRLRNLLLQKTTKQYRWTAAQLSGTSTITSLVLTNHFSKDSRAYRLWLVSAGTTHRSSSRWKTPFIWLPTVNTTRDSTVRPTHAYHANTQAWPGVSNPPSAWCAARCLNRPEGPFMTKHQELWTTISGCISTKLRADLVKRSLSPFTCLPWCCSLSSDVCAAGRTRNISSSLSRCQTKRRKPSKSDQSLSEVVSECYKQGRKWELFYLCSSYN